MSVCTETKLSVFSKKHYTYINQIFGDETVREIISEVFPNPKYSFAVQNANADFDADSKHHILLNNETKEEVCSVDNGNQNMNANINDTLCQSYTLLTYFGHKIPKNRIKKQLLMIEMYTTLLKNKDFVKKLDSEILGVKENKHLWVDYTRTVEQNVNMNKDVILRNMKDVLKKWKSYGHLFFISNGRCP